MPTLTLIANNITGKESLALLVASAKRKKVPTTICSGEDAFAPLEQKAEMLYRINMNDRACLLEQTLTGPQTATFQTVAPRRANVEDKLFQAACFQNASVPYPKTIFASQSSDAEKVVEWLGLPVVVKILGSHRGAGVAIAPNLAALRSFMDTLEAVATPFICQEFVPDLSGHIRAIVLGDRVIAAGEYVLNTKNDFRTNAGDINLSAVNIEDDAARTSVQAAAAIGVEFAGVDLIPSKQGYLVLEANFPCNFSRLQNKLHIDISGEMIDFLVKKYHSKKMLVGRSA